MTLIFSKIMGNLTLCQYSWVSVHSGHPRPWVEPLRGSPPQGMAPIKEETLLEVRKEIFSIGYMVRLKLKKVL